MALGGLIRPSLENARCCKNVKPLYIHDSHCVNICYLILWYFPQVLCYGFKQQQQLWWLSLCFSWVCGRVGVLWMNCVPWRLYLKRPGDHVSTPCQSSWCASQFQPGSGKMAVFLKAPFLLEDIHFALVSLSFAHEKIHHCVYKCQIAMQIGICVPNYPFCVFAKRMCRQILQVWVGRPLEIWLPLSQHQIRWCVLTVSGRRKQSGSKGQPWNTVTGVEDSQAIHNGEGSKQLKSVQTPRIGLLELMSHAS